MDWKTLLIGALIGAILGGIIGLPFNIFGNMVTSPVQNYFKNRSLSRQQRKINKIVDEFQTSESLAGNFEGQVIYLLLNIGAVVIVNSILLLLIGVYVVFPADSSKLPPLLKTIGSMLGSLAYGYGAIAFAKGILHAASLFVNSLNLEKTREEAKEKLLKLGVKPRDVNKELKKEIPDEDE